MVVVVSPFRFPFSPSRLVSSTLVSFSSRHLNSRTRTTFTRTTSTRTTSTFVTSTLALATPLLAPPLLSSPLLSSPLLSSPLLAYSSTRLLLYSRIPPRSVPAPYPFHTEHNLYSAHISKTRPSPFLTVLHSIPYSSQCAHSVTPLSLFIPLHRSSLP